MKSGMIHYLHHYNITTPINICITAQQHMYVYTPVHFFFLEHFLGAVEVIFPAFSFAFLFSSTAGVFRADLLLVAALSRFEGHFSHSFARSFAIDPPLDDDDDDDSVSSVALLVFKLSTSRSLAVAISDTAGLVHGKVLSFSHSSGTIVIFPQHIQISFAYTLLGALHYKKNSTSQLSEYS